MLRALSFTGLLLMAAPALAQNPQTTTPSNPTVPMAPPNSPSPPPEKLAPSTGVGNDGGTHGGNLSDQLSQQRGTIRPPNVDPGMTVTPPKTGAATTPVIPPPGSPGGNPSVVPK